MTCDPVHSILSTFPKRWFLTRMKQIYQQDSLSSLLFWIEAQQVHQETTAQAKRKITQGMEAPLLWLHAWKLRTSQLIRHNWACVRGSSQGTMAFTVQAATWEPDLFMFSLVSLWGITYGCFFLYSNATRAAGTSSFLVPKTSLFFFRN